MERGASGHQSSSASFFFRATSASLRELNSLNISERNEISAAVGICTLSFNKHPSHLIPYKYWYAQYVTLATIST